MNLIKVTSTYKLPPNYDLLPEAPLGEPILIVADGMTVYQDKSYYTETKELSLEEFKEYVK